MPKQSNLNQPEDRAKTLLQTIGIYDVVLLVLSQFITFDI